MQTRPDTNASPPLTLRKSQAGSEECPAHAWLPTPAPPTLPLAGVPRPHPPRPSRGAPREAGRSGSASAALPHAAPWRPGQAAAPPGGRVLGSAGRQALRTASSLLRERNADGQLRPGARPARALPAPQLLRPHRPWAASTWPPGSPRPAGGGGPSFQGAAGGRAHRGDRARTTASELTQSAESAVGREGAPVCRRRAREGAWSEWAVPPRPPRRPSPRAFPSGPRSNEGRRAGPEGARAGPRQRQARG